MELAGEIFGFSATLTGFFLFQQKERKRLMLLKLACDVLWVMHFFLLGAYSGMAISMVGCLRDLVFFITGKKEKGSSILSLIFFICVNVISVCLMWSGTWSVCSLITGVLSTIAFWCPSPIHTKKISLVVCVSQLTYAIAVGSYAAMFNEIVAMTSIVLFFIRYKSKHKHLAQKV